MKVNSSGDTSHTINSGLGGKCFRTNTPRKGRIAERTEEIGGRRQQFKLVFVGVPGSHQGNQGLKTIKGAVLIYSGEKFRPVVSLDHDYDVKHWGRSMYSGDAKVSTAKKTDIIRGISEKSHRFQRVHPSGKSPMVSPVKVDVKRSDNSDSVMYYESKGNHNVGCSSQIAPIQMDVKEKLSTGGVYSNIYPDQHVPLRSDRGDCKGSESQEEGRFRCVVPEDTTKNKLFPPEKRQISDRKIGMSHIQPSNIYQLEERQICMDRVDIYKMDVTGCDYNERVTPHSTEQFYGIPIRYNSANGCILGWIVVTTGKEVVKQNKQSGRWMSITTDEEGNSRYRNGYDSRLSHTIGIKGQSREGDWVSEQATKSEKRADHTKAGDSDRMHILKSTPSLAGVGTVTQTARVWTEVPHSIYVWGKRGARGIRQCQSSQVVVEDDVGLK